MASMGRKGAPDEPQPAGLDRASEQEERESHLVERVVASFGATPDSRLKELMQALTRHLHAFAQEVRLTEEEWQRAPIAAS